MAAAPDPAAAPPAPGADRFSGLKNFGAALGAQPHLQAVRDGVVGALPLILLGSGFLLLAQPPWPGLARFLPPVDALKAAKAGDLRSEAESHPLVQAILKTFPGAKLDTVRRRGENAASLVAGLAGEEEPPPAEDYPVDDIPESDF